MATPWVASTAFGLDYFVATNGSDDNLGASNSPFATLEKARDSIRNLARPLSGPVQVILRGGTYELPQTFRLTPQDSGSAAAPITYRAAGGERVVLSGGIRITNEWIRQTNDLWAVDIPGTSGTVSHEVNGDSLTTFWNIRQLFVNGRREIRARYPNVDQPNPFLYPAAGSSSSTLKLAPGIVKASWGQAKDAQINISPSFNWYNRINDVVGVDVASNAIYLGPRERYNDTISSNNWFWIEGVREELDEAREWFLDTDIGRLYYWAEPGVNPNQQSVVTARLLTVMSLKGDINEGTQVRYVNLMGLEFHYTTYFIGLIEPRSQTYAALQLENASHCRIENCRFVNVGGYGIWLHLNSCDNVIESNEVAEAGAGGVLLTSAYLGPNTTTPITPGAAAASAAPLRNYIAHNYIHETGGIEPFTYGAAQPYYRGPQLRTYCAGVHLDSRPASTATAQGNYVGYNTMKNLSRNGIFAFRNQGGNVIEYNRIENGLLTSQDGGAIHLATCTKITSPNYIRGNVADRMIGTAWSPGSGFVRSIARGVYLDIFTSWCRVGDNLTYNTSTGGTCILGGDNNVFDNNVSVLDATPSQIKRWATTFGGSVSVNNVDERNIFLAADSNTLFVNANAGDFTLRPDYPDYPDGFVPFDPSQAGTNGAEPSVIASNQLNPDILVAHAFDPATQVTGLWSANHSIVGGQGFDEGRLVSSGTSGSVTFTLPVSQTGEYDVRLFYASDPSYCSAVAVAVTHADGTSALTVDQTQTGQWPTVGTYRFVAGQNAHVTIYADPAGKPVNADSLALIPRPAKGGFLEGGSVATPDDRPIEVDLFALADDAAPTGTGVVFRVSGALNGSVTLRPGGRTARFIPDSGTNITGQFNYQASYPLRPFLRYGFEPPDTIDDRLVSDASGYARDGTVKLNGPSGSCAYTANVPEALNSVSSRSLQLDGGASLHRDLKIGEFNPSDHSWSFSGWFKRDSTNDDDFIFYLGSGTGFGSGPGLQLYGPANEDSLRLEYYSGTGGSEVSLAKAGAASKGDWHHVTLTFGRTAPRTGLLQMYVDGVLADSANTNFVFDLDDSSLNFGGHAGSTTIERNFNGNLDELQFFTTALSASEVTSLAAGGAVWRTNSGTFAILVAPPDNESTLPSTNAAPSPTLRYNFDAATGPALDGGIAPSAPGVFVGNATRTGQTPWGTGYALDLSHGANDYVTAGNPAKLNGLTSFTLTTWLDLRGMPEANDRLIDKISTSGGFGWRITPPHSGTLSAANFKTTVQINNLNTAADATADMGADHQWAFLAVTYDGTWPSGNVVFYYGTTDTQVAQLGLAVTRNSGFITNNTSDLRIGSTPATTADRTPPAWFDDARVYDRVLSLTELEHIRLESHPNANTLPVAQAPAQTENGIELRVSGTPERTCQLWRALEVQGPWTNILNAIMDSEGAAVFLDTDPPAKQAFYHAVVP